ncbi:MAG: LicD family protein [Lachnospiraceae bacterium]|nr:LicD family protein [Lachnospiraceae bacterium]
MKLISDLEEVKNIEFEILKYIHNICEKNNLVYYMAGGTLLGAVRHKGFIPWDDDIDLLMFREDYIKLIDIINNDDSYYSMKCIESDNNYVGTFAKVIDNRTKVIFNKIISDGDIGIFVDIFPMDGLGNNYKKSAGFVNRTSSLYKKFADLKMTIPENKFSRFVLNKCVWFFEAVAKRKKCKGSRYIARVVNIRGEREIMKYSWFAKRILLKFETEKFYAPVGYHYYLKRIYGDYMKLPPHAEQRLVHSYNAYWKK